MSFFKNFNYGSDDFDDDDLDYTFDLYDKRTRLSILPFKIGEIITCRLIGYDFIISNPRNERAYEQILRLDHFGYTEFGLKAWTEDTFKRGFKEDDFLEIVYIHVLENDCKYKYLDFGFTFEPNRFRIVPNIHKNNLNLAKYPDLEKLP